MTIRSAPVLSRRAATCWLGALCFAALAGCASTASVPAWPERVVSIDKMTLLTPMRATVLTKSPDRTRVSTVVLQVHVDAQGQAVQSRVEQSSGNGRLDEAAMHAMRTARFAPYQEDGVVQAVTVVAPMHFPFEERKR